MKQKPTALHKKLKFSDEVLTSLAGLRVEPKGGGHHFVGRLTCGQLDRALYVQVDKALQALGGKWNRQLGGHIFQQDPRPRLATLIGAGGELTVKKEGWFPTPESVARQMLDLARLAPGHFVLEPSAGEGAIADLVHASAGVPKARIACVEANPYRAGVLREKGYPVLAMDFLAATPEHFGGRPFDRVLMNPPFELMQDIDHVRHAYNLLKPGGILVAVMSPGPFFRNDRKAVQFRSFLAAPGGLSWPLPAGAFTVAARLVALTKPPGESPAAACTPCLSPPGDYPALGLTETAIVHEVETFVQAVFSRAEALEPLAIELYGSRTTGAARWGADLDVKLFYRGALRAAEISRRLRADPLILYGCFDGHRVALTVDFKPIKI